MPLNNATAPMLGRPANQRSAMRPAEPDRWARHLGRIAASYPLARPGITAGSPKLPRAELTWADPALPDFSCTGHDRAAEDSGIGLPQEKTPSDPR
jgi:hypothetical protein